MAEVILLATSFPSVFYTVLLGVVLVYWAFVMSGVVSIGEGSEGALDGLGADGAVKGALEGATKGALEGGAKGVLEGAFEADADVDLDVDADGHHSGLLAAILSALRVQQVPVTLVLSLLIAFSWLSSVVAMQAVARFAPGLTAWAAWAAFFVSPVVAFPLTVLAVRPIAKVFVKRKAPSRADLVGRTCVVRTGKVTDRFGEGTLEDGGAGLVVRVRVSDGKQEMARGDHALIIDYDAASEAFVVEPFDDLLNRQK